MRLIDADRLLGKLEKRRGYIKMHRDDKIADVRQVELYAAKYAESLHVTEVVEKMASEAVEVVRCKDCIESEDRNGRLFCGVFCCYMGGDDFCSGGLKEGKSFQEWCEENMTRTSAIVDEVSE